MMKFEKCTAVTGSWEDPKVEKVSAAKADKSEKAKTDESAKP